MSARPKSALTLGASAGPPAAHPAPSSTPGHRGRCPGWPRRLSGGGRPFGAAVRLNRRRWSLRARLEDEGFFGCEAAARPSGPSGGFHGRAAGPQARAPVAVLGGVHCMRQAAWWAPRARRCDATQRVVRAPLAARRGPHAAHVRLRALVSQSLFVPL